MNYYDAMELKLRAAQGLRVDAQRLAEADTWLAQHRTYKVAGGTVEPTSEPAPPLADQGRRGTGGDRARALGRPRQGHRHLPPGQPAAAGRADHALDQPLAGTAKHAVVRAVSSSDGYDDADPTLEAVLHVHRYEVDVFDFYRGRAG